MLWLISMGNTSPGTIADRKGTCVLPKCMKLYSSDSDTGAWAKAHSAPKPAVHPVVDLLPNAAMVPGGTRAARPPGVRTLIILGIPLLSNTSVGTEEGLKTAVLVFWH